MSIRYLRLALAAAVLATLGAAQAQTPQGNVTVFGVVDLGYLDSSPNSVPGRAATSASTRGLEDGIQTPSRFGLYGTEPLGGGLSARFWLEGGFAADTGTSQQGGRLFGRQAWAALQGGWGELRLGRQYGVGYEYFITGVSPFGTTFRDAGLGNVFSSASGRLILDNMVEYRTPILSGFSAALGYSFNAAAQEVPGNGNNTNVLTTGAQYRSGPIVAVISYESINCPGNTTTIVSNTCNAQRKEDQTHLQVGGSFDFKVIKVYGAYAQEENQFTLSAITPSEDATVWMLGASAPLFGGEALAAWQDRSDDAYGADLTVWGIGYTYPLSNRTNLYAFYADTSADSSPRAQASAGGVITAEGYTAAQINGYWDRNRSQFGFGLRHRF
jgi:predicted porin